MKTLSVALAVALCGSLAGAGAANAVTPKVGAWKVKLDGAAAPRGAQAGSLTVVARKGKLSVATINAPGFYVRCTGAGAQPEEVNPGFDGQFGLGGPFRISKKGAFGGSSRSRAGTARTQSFSGTFTSQRRAKGTLRVRITGSAARTCDSGAVKWRASKK